MLSRVSIPANSCRLSIKGHLGGNEIFETGWWIVSSGSAQSDAQAMAEACAAAFTGSIATALKNLLGTDDGWDSVRAYNYPSGGPSAANIGEAPITSGAGTSTFGSIPYQVAMVATLRTDLAGRRHRGRMYLPAPEFGVMAADHHFDSSTVDGVATAIATWLENTNSALSVGGGPVVVSTTGSMQTPITSVAVDNRPDVQRRRANKFPVTHTGTHSVTP